MNNCSPDEALYPPTRSPGALRMARHRNRRRKGLRCITIEVRETEITTLKERGWLSSEDREDRMAVQKALYSFFDYYLR